MEVKEMVTAPSRCKPNAPKQIVPNQFISFLNPWQLACQCKNILQFKHTLHTDKSLITASPLQTMPFHWAVQEQPQPRSLHQCHSPLHWAIFLKLSMQVGSSKYTSQTYFLTGFPAVLVYRVCCPEGLCRFPCQRPANCKIVPVTCRSINIDDNLQEEIYGYQWPFPKYWSVQVQQNSVLPIDIHIPSVQNVPVNLVQNVTGEAVGKEK